VKSDEPVTVTRRGRAVAVMVSPTRYNQIEEALRRLDELELMGMVRNARRARANGKTISQSVVKRCLMVEADEPAISEP
jgi:PHD/YefM family antitoxin component YafN of YafNO toxin-antitoxin module